MSADDIQKAASRDLILQAMGRDDGRGQFFVDLGRAIGTRFMIFGDITKQDSTYTISLQLIDTRGENAGITNRVSEKCKCDTDTLIGTVEDVAAKLIGKPTAAAIKKAEETPEEKKTNQSRTKPAQSFDKTFIDPITGMEFLLVVGGCFQMGDTLNSGNTDDKPVHEVCVSPYYLGKYEVTQSEYLKITGNNPSIFKNDRNPVENVSWEDVQIFLHALNAKSGNNYRLPTEAEWEYVAKEGKKEKTTDEMDGWCADNSNKSTHQVGQRKPNGFGFYDILGNVGEWCNDKYAADYYSKSPKDNPTGSNYGELRVVRGGNWYDHKFYLKPSRRRQLAPKLALDRIGFRVALPIEILSEPRANNAKVIAEEKYNHVDPTSGIEFVLVPGGCFQMGTPDNVKTGNGRPIHEVCVDTFYIGKYEVTQSEYQSITGKNPSVFNKGGEYPVDSVSWEDTQKFLEELNSKTDKIFRLPTEAEWEFAAKSGGKKENWAGGNDYFNLAWYKRNSSLTSHPVGMKQPNGLNIHDMSGNLWEWCNDWFDESFYKKSPRDNPKGPLTGSLRVLRGGSWQDLTPTPVDIRNSNTPNYAISYYGFRIVYPLSESKRAMAK